MVLIPVLVGIGAIVFNWTVDKTEKISITEEARWLSRYLHQAKGDYALANKLARLDPPTIGTKFLKNWESVVSSENEGRYPIARRSDSHSGMVIVIWNDLTCGWIKQTDWETENFRVNASDQ